MIIIFSKRNDEFVNAVIELLPKNKIIRIDSDKIFNSIEYCFTDNDYKFTINGKINSIELSQIQAVWYFGGKFNLQNKQNDITDQNSVFQEIEKSIYLLLTNNAKVIIGQPSQKSNNNKINDLVSARKHGLKIPDFLLTTKKSSLLDFMGKNKCSEFICKKISSEHLVRSKNGGIQDISKTILLNDEKIKNIPTRFGLSFFQKKINRKYEVRAIYFNGKFYAAAIFPKIDSVDYRSDFHTEDSPRIVPYKLPVNIKRKIKKLMLSLNYDTGSIDLIFNENSEHIFLEINPVGHISFINNNCNFNLQQEFANFLRNSENE